MRWERVTDEHYFGSDVVAVRWGGGPGWDYPRSLWPLPARGGWAAFTYSLRVFSAVFI